MSQAIVACRRVLAAKSKSFALAARLLPRSCRDDVAVIYAWCRHVDDAIDLAPRDERPAALARLRAEVDEVWSARAPADPLLAAFAAVARARAIPRLYADELLAGMEMDVVGQRYPSLQDLLHYCYRVAGVVGLILCHVMGLTDRAAARRAAHLGIAMQLTNICRDVAEDQADGRLYLPADLLAGGVPAAVARLLIEADRFYRSADRGIAALPFRCALAVHAARLLYSAIGGRLRRAGHDPFAGRAFVPAGHKLLLVVRAVGRALAELPRRLRSPARHLPPERTYGFPHDVV